MKNYILVMIHFAAVSTALCAVSVQAQESNPPNAEVLKTLMTEGQATRAYVVKNIQRIQKLAPKQNRGRIDFTSMSIRTSSLTCMGFASGVKPFLGTCTAMADLDYGNSSSFVAITISERNPGAAAPETEIEVRVISTEI